MKPGFFEMIWWLVLNIAKFQIFKQTQIETPAKNTFERKFIFGEAEIWSLKQTHIDDC